MQVPGRGDQVVETLAAGTVLGWSWLYPPYRWHFGAVARAAGRRRRVRRRVGAPALRRRPGFGYAMLRLFTPVITERLQATRLRLLDLYAAPTPGELP